MDTAVKVPLLNPNEPEASLVEVCVVEGAWVEKDQRLAVLETSKSTYDVCAPRSGYVRRVPLAGTRVDAGATLCYLTDKLDESLPEGPAAQALPNGLRITKKALLLARDLGIDLSLFPTSEIVTEAAVRGLAKTTSQPKQRTQSNEVILYGAGGHGGTVCDLIVACGHYQVAGVIDDGVPRGTKLLGTSVLGAADHLPVLYERGIRYAVNCVGGITRLSTRIAVFERLETANFYLPTLVHPRAIVEPSARLEAGVQVLANAYVGSKALVEYGAIVNTSGILSHDCVLGSFSHVSPGAIIAGTVKIGRRTLIGMGATVSFGVSIGADVMIGNSAVIHSDVPDGAIVRAGSVWPR